jgi:hypothetical protein
MVRNFTKMNYGRRIEAFRKWQKSRPNRRQLSICKALEEVCPPQFKLKDVCSLDGVPMITRSRIQWLDRTLAWTSEGLLEGVLLQSEATPIQKGEKLVRIPGPFPIYNKIKLLSGV